MSDSLTSPAPDPKAPWVAAAVALGLGIALTWPVVLAPTQRIVGHPGNDTWNHVWGYWWVGSAVMEGRSITDASGLSHPTGGTLWFIDTVQVLLSLPVQLLGGPVLAYNAVVIGSLAFAGFCAWLLVRRLIQDPVAAGLALVVYEASPHLMGQTYNGISETICTGWLPLTLWCLIRLLDRPTWRRGAVLGLVAALCMLTSWYYGLFAALSALVLVLWRAIRQHWTHQWKPVLASLVVAGAVWSTLVAPVLMIFRKSLDAPDALVTRDPEFVRASLLNHNITDIAAFFRPSKVASPDLFALYGEELLIVIYLGWTLIFLVGIAFWQTRRQREMAPWMWVGLVFFLFSLGPYLYFSGAYLEWDNRRIPMPFMVLFEALPLFDRISHPFRFVVGVTLVLALLASHGLRHLLRNLPRAPQLAVVATLSVLFLVEVRLGSPAHIPVPHADASISEAYTHMANDPVQGAVLDLPLAVPNLERAIYIWYQAVHGRPVPWGLNDPMPGALLANRLVTTLIRLEASRARRLPPQFPELDMVISARNLARQGYRYVVVHENLYPTFKRQQVEAVLSGVFGPPVSYPDDQLLVYQVPSVDGDAS